MSTVNSPDEIIEELGGCGRYQWRMGILVHIMKTVICWSFFTIIFASATPPWYCADNILQTDMSYNTSYNASHALNISIEKSCVTMNNSACKQIVFKEGMKTMVSEFGLVCDLGYIPSMLMSVQMAGTLFGNVFSGHMADLFGRKIPFFSSFIILLISNFMGFMAPNWIVTLLSMTLTGIGAGFFLTIQYNLLSEFSLAKWRTWIIGFPSWPVQACLFSLVAWLLKDWRYIYLTCSIMCIPCLISWWFIPESFRWYIAHDRPEDAQKIIETVAKVNKHPAPGLETMRKLTDTTAKGDTKYTICHLFMSRYLVRITLLSALNWFTLGLVAYGIKFGIQKLSGSFYMNLFLFNLTGIPAKAIAMWLQNRFGRRAASILSYVTVAIGGSVVGIVQYIDTDMRDSLTNGFAILANVGVTTAWGPVQTMTVELFPTVVRSIGFGSLSTLSRVGAIAGPQLVFLDEFYPGILYFTCAATSAACVACLCGLPETVGAHLPDRLGKFKRVDNHNTADSKSGPV